MSAPAVSVAPTVAAAVLFLAVNPKVWLVLGLVFLLGLLRRLWHAWRARRQADEADHLVPTPPAE